ncbi:UNVERIFIED_CONTAM: hypothetical protein GTU68_054605 [Idotea baltica]|nr:hypothetical protein [Idotea baltica]
MNLANISKRFSSLCVPTHGLSNGTTS